VLLLSGHRRPQYRLVGRLAWRASSRPSGRTRPVWHALRNSFAKRFLWKVSKDLHLIIQHRRQWQWHNQLVDHCACELSWHYWQAYTLLGAWSLEKVCSFRVWRYTNAIIIFVPNILSEARIQYWFSLSVCLRPHRNWDGSPWAVPHNWQDGYMTYKPRKLGQTDLVLGFWSEFLTVGPCLHNYKSLRTAAIWSVLPWLTHIYTDSFTISPASCTNQLNSAFHPSGVGKWVPASAGKTKAGMVYSVSGWTLGVQVKLWDPLRTRAIPERLRGVFTTRRYTNPRLPLLYWLTDFLRLTYFLTGKWDGKCPN